MKTKRNWRRVLKRLLAVALSVAIIAVAYNVIYNIIATDDLTMRQNYETVKEKHESLKMIANDSIEEGQGIRIDQLSKAGVQFKIYNDGENIILYYYINEKNGDEYPYKATITLSNDYEILDEEYSEAAKFEDYKWTTELIEHLFAMAGGFFIFAALYFVLCISQTIYHLIKWAINLKKKPKHEIKTINNHTEQEMRKNFAGEYIANPEQLPDGFKVTVFEKGSKQWWEHGHICTRKKDSKKAINCGDGFYELSDVEVYIDTRYS